MMLEASKCRIILYDLIIQLTFEIPEASFLALLALRRSEDGRVEIQKDPEKKVDSQRFLETRNLLREKPF